MPGTPASERRVSNEWRISIANPWHTNKSARAISSFLISNAQREVLQEASLMMASAKSARDCTSSDLTRLFEQNPQHKTRFLAETVPAFGAISTFNKLRQNYPEYTYREATLNPTNPEHRAT
jgi:uncharacterized protein DUF3365